MDKRKEFNFYMNDIEKKMGEKTKTKRNVKKVPNVFKVDDLLMGDTHKRLLPTKN